MFKRNKNVLPKKVILLLPKRKETVKFRIPRGYKGFDLYYYIKDYDSGSQKKCAFIQSVGFIAQRKRLIVFKPQKNYNIFLVGEFVK